MDIYNKLPIELQRKINYYVLEHPVAIIINDEIERLKCNLTFKFKDKSGVTICKINGRQFFCNEYFRQLKDEDSSTSSDVDDEIFNSIFQVSSSSEDEEE